MHGYCILSFNSAVCKTFLSKPKPEFGTQSEALFQAKKNVRQVAYLSGKFPEKNLRYI